MLNIIGWIIWTIVTFFAISFVFGCRTYAKTKESFQITTGVQTFFLCLISVLFLVPSWNKLHILWIAPAIFFSAPFLVLGNIPILSLLILGATKIFLKIALFGIKIKK